MVVRSNSVVLLTGCQHGDAGGGCYQVSRGREGPLKGVWGRGVGGGDGQMGRLESVYVCVLCLVASA